MSTVQVASHDSQQLRIKKCDNGGVSVGVEYYCSGQMVDYQEITLPSTPVEIVLEGEFFTTKVTKLLPVLP
jgi:hypothetical protein